jgi:hypothetical protein
MSPGIVLSPLVWNWYVGFFMSMGMVSSVAISFAFGLLTIDWFYLIAKRISSAATPTSYVRAQFNLFRFQAIVLGTVLAPVAALALYYLLISIVSKLTPGLIEAPGLDYETGPLEEYASNMASLLVFVGLVSLCVTAGIYFFLSSYAKTIRGQAFPAGLGRMFIKRYFSDNLFLGRLLMLISLPVVIYFFYNIALLVLAISPPDASWTDPDRAPECRRSLYVFCGAPKFLVGRRVIQPGRLAGVSRRAAQMALYNRKPSHEFDLSTLLQAFLSCISMQHRVRTHVLLGGLFCQICGFCSLCVTSHKTSEHTENSSTVFFIKDEDTSPERAIESGYTAGSMRKTG